MIETHAFKIVSDIGPNKFYTHESWKIDDLRTYVASSEFHAWFTWEYLLSTKS